jgi:hypothetical protein
VALVDLRGLEESTDVTALRGGEPWSGVLLGWCENERLEACLEAGREGDDVRIHALHAVRPDAGSLLLEAFAERVNAARILARRGAVEPSLLLGAGFEPDGLELARTLDVVAAEPAAVSAATLEELEAAIRNAWAADTSADPDRWSSDDPAHGQCDATARVVRDLLGGEILIANVVLDGRRLERHAWNRLPSGLTIDLTREQYHGAERLSQPQAEEPLGLARGDERYAILARRVREALAAASAG